MSLVTFRGGVWDGQEFDISPERMHAMVPHPIPQRSEVAESEPIRVDHYRRRRRAAPDGSLLSEFVYEGTS